MARYRKIDVRVWVDQKFCDLSPLPPCGQALWLYLLTNPDTTSIPGLFRAGEAAMAEALGWPLKAFREAFLEVSRKGMAKANWEARVVWIPKAIEYNKPESPNVVKGWATYWDEIPECDLKEQAYQTLITYMKGLSKGYQEAFKAIRKPSKKPSGKPFGKTRPIQEQEQEYKKLSLSARAREEIVDNPQTLIPDDYQPPPDMEARLLRAGRTDIDPTDPTLLTKFIAHHQGKGTTSANWDAMYLTWCLRERKSGGHDNGETDRRSRTKRVADKLDEIARRDIEENGLPEVLG